jgi:peptidoglycan/LPS O-acetylase OafA/YrhL
VLRAVAVLCVLANHVGLLVHPPAEWIALVTRIGNAGVQLFFVHTALVLMASLERGGPDRHWIRTFYLRRALRIYPLAIATVILVVVARIPRLVPVIGVHAEPSAWSGTVVAANAALVQNLLNLPDVLGPFWTLPVEVDMYLLLPFCFLVARRPGARGMVALLASLVVASFATTGSVVPGAWRLNVFQYGPCFFGGVLAYHLLRTRARPTLSPWLLPFVIGAAVASVPILAAFAPEYLKLWLPCLFLGLALPGIAELPPSVITDIGRTIARYSYGIYLLHVPIFWFAFDACRALPLAAQVVVALVGIFVVPWAAFHAIEQPAIRWGQQLTHRRLTLAATQPAP